MKKKLLFIISLITFSLYSAEPDIFDIEECNFDIKELVTVYDPKTEFKDEVVKLPEQIRLKAIQVFQILLKQEEEKGIPISMKNITDLLEYYRKENELILLRNKLETEIKVDLAQQEQEV